MGTGRGDLQLCCDGQFGRYRRRNLTGPDSRQHDSREFRGQRGRSRRCDAARVFAVRQRGNEYRRRRERINAEQLPRHGKHGKERWRVPSLDRARMSDSRQRRQYKRRWHLLCRMPQLHHHRQFGVKLRGALGAAALQHDRLLQSIRLCPYELGRSNKRRQLLLGYPPARKWQYHERSSVFLVGSPFLQFPMPKRGQFCLC